MIEYEKRTVTCRDAGTASGPRTLRAWQARPPNAARLAGSVRGPGWNDGAGIGAAAPVISSHLSEKSRLAGGLPGRLRRPRADRCGRRVQCAQGTLQATAGVPGAHGTPVLSVSGDKKLLFKMRSCRGPAQRTCRVRVCSLNWSCGSRPARARCKLDPRDAGSPVKFSTGV